MQRKKKEEDKTRQMKENTRESQKEEDARKKTQKMGVQRNMEEKDDAMHAITLDERATEMAARNRRNWQWKERPVVKSNILQFSSYVNEEKER